MECDEIMKRLFQAVLILGFITSSCLTATAQDLSFRYMPEEETAYGLRVFWRGGEYPVQVLIGIRDKDKDYGPYKRLEVIRFNRGQQLQKPVALPASLLTPGPEVLANFSPSGVLWYARSTAENKIRINRVTGTEVIDREIQLGTADLILSTLRVISDTEFWLVGQQASKGILIKLSSLTKTPEVQHIALPFGLKDILPTSTGEFILAGANLANAHSNALAVTTHLALAGVGLKLIAEGPPIEGWLQDISLVSPNLVAALTSKPEAGELLLHILTTTLAFNRSIPLIKQRSFTGRAFLTSFKDFVIVYASNLGKCSFVVVDPNTGNLVRRESIATGQDRCIDIRVAESGNQVLIVSTAWRLQGNSFRVGIQSTTMSLDDLVANLR